jgi:hypothetical protein
MALPYRQANSYQCRKLTPEDGQGTPETCGAAKVKWKKVLKMKSSWLLIYTSNDLTCFYIIRE